MFSKSFCCAFNFIILFFLLSVPTSEANDYYPFLEISVGYKLTETESLAYNFCRWPATVKFGFEYRGGYSLGIQHRSNYDCGFPLNHLPEYSADEIFISKKFGGIKRDK